MAITEIHLLPTDKSPEVYLSPSGIILIKGRGLMQNNSDLIQKITEWISEYLPYADELTCVILAFEYLNSFTTVNLISILRELTQLHTTNKKFIVKWYYEEGDHDILERGEHISTVVDIPFQFIKTNSIAGIYEKP
jgi:hypothetical protein